MISVALLIALIAVATTHIRSEPLDPEVDTNATVQSCADGMATDSTKPPKSAGVFDDLTVEEITSVRDYLLMQAELNLTSYLQATLNIYLSYTVAASFKR